MFSESITTPSVLESEVLFTLKRKQSTFETEEVVGSNEVITEPEEHLQSDTLLCILWNNNKIGAAFYSIQDHQLHVLQEITDYAPQFATSQLLYLEVNPIHTITIGSPCDEFVKFLINLTVDASDKNSDGIESVQTRKLPPNLSLINSKQCTFEACEQKINGVSLACEPENITDAQKEVFIHSLIDFDSKMSVYALGALIMYIEKNWMQLSQNKNDDLKFLNINQISLPGRVFIDRNAYNGLHIFETRNHDSNFKHGRISASREGPSIYKIFSQQCKSKLGLIYMRNLLLNPITSIDELNKRLDFIELTMTPSNKVFVDGLQENLKKIYYLNKILTKIQYCRANSSDWKVLYTTIYHMLFLHEICAPYRSSSAILRDLDESIKTELYDLQAAMDKAIDFTQKMNRNRPFVKPGLDSELDSKRLRKQDITKNVTTAARFAMTQLPEFVNECSVVHIPETGYLVAVKKWEPNCNHSQLKNYGYQFVFQVNDTFYYKNAMCLELNRQLGNIHDDILAHENRIIQRLAGYLMRYNRYICEPLKLVSLIDSLLSVSCVSKEKGYIRPCLNEESVNSIIGGRYPLLELHSSNFVPNDYFSGGKNTRIKIITGPNNSGKSVYLRQTALIIFLAHVGFYIPAKSANIGITHSIHCRLHATESVTTSLSAFMLDLSQMSQALHYAKQTSLVILDEFGRGTTGNDGISLLMGALKQFEIKENSCPHVLVSTHLQQICHYLTTNKIIDHLKLSHTRCEKGTMVFLYKVVKGISNSYAFEVAESAGLDEMLIKRAKELYCFLYEGAPLYPLESGSLQQNMLDLGNISIPEPDD